MIKTWRRAAVCLTVTLLMSLAMVSTVAAANKSLKLSNAHFNKAEGSPFGVRGAELCAGFLKNDKLKKSGMKPKKTDGERNGMACWDLQKPDMIFISR